MGLRAAREETNNRPINRHGLIGLILNGKGVSHPNPRIEETTIQFDGFLEVLPGDLKLLAVEVVSANGEPTDGVRGIVLY